MSIQFNYQNAGLLGKPGYESMKDALEARLGK